MCIYNVNSTIFIHAFADIFGKVLTSLKMYINSNGLSKKSVILFSKCSYAVKWYKHPFPLCRRFIFHSPKKERKRKSSLFWFLVYFLFPFLNASVIISHFLNITTTFSFYFSSKFMYFQSFSSSIGFIIISWSPFSWLAFPRATTSISCFRGYPFHHSWVYLIYLSTV